MTFWQIMYLIVLIFSLALAAYSTAVKGLGNGQSSAQSVGFFIGSLIVYNMVTSLVVLAICLLYLGNVAIWNWLGCLGGC